jgi:fermentation-respiration switch protein FrsA (DUF1100 family)
MYLGGVTSLYVFQRDMLYAFTQFDPDLRAIELGFMQRVTFPTADGGMAGGYYAEAPQDRPTILFFHGQGGELANTRRKLAYFAQHGFGVLGVMYRGSGGSKGVPTEASIIDDARAAYDWLSARGIGPKSIFTAGESLGTDVAVQLAASRPLGAVALGAPYTSIEDEAAGRYWFAPVRLLLKDRFRSDQFITSLGAPLLVVHGEDDKIVPFVFGAKLFAAAAEPKTMVALKGRGHDAIFDPALWQVYLDFFNRVANQ